MTDGDLYSVERVTARCDGGPWHGREVTLRVGCDLKVVGGIYRQHVTAGDIAPEWRLIWEAE